MPPLRKSHNEADSGEGARVRNVGAQGQIIGGKWETRRTAKGETMKPYSLLLLFLALGAQGQQIVAVKPGNCLCLVPSAPSMEPKCPPEQCTRAKKPAPKKAKPLLKAHDIIGVPDGKTDPGWANSPIPYCNDPDLKENDPCWRVPDPVDVPAVQETTTEPQNCSLSMMWPSPRDGWLKEGGCGSKRPLVWTCRDKSRVLLTSEDGVRHCFRVQP